MATKLENLVGSKKRFFPEQSWTTNCADQKIYQVLPEISQQAHYQYLVAHYGNLAGNAPLKGTIRVFPAELRRTCGRTAYEHGANLLSIAAFLGFNHLESAARFIEVFDRADPNAAIDRNQSY